MADYDGPSLENIDYEADDNPFEDDCHGQLVTVEPALAVSVVERIRKTAKAIRKSPQQRANFETMVGLACPGGSKVNCLILDVHTHWNSTYAMLQCAYDLRLAFDMYVQANPKMEDKSLNAAEWNVVKELLSLLKPLEKVTTFLSKSHYPTVSATLPTYFHLLRVR